MSSSPGSSRLFGPIRNASGHASVCAGLGLLLCSSIGAGAQSSSKDAAIATLKATSRIVYVDVVVRDGYGHIVHGLKPENFLLTENRKPQTISLFEEHSPSGAPASTKSVEVADGAAGGQPRRISNVPKSEPGAPLDMVLLDLIDTAPTDQVWARVQMIQFLRNLPPGHQVALFILSDRLHMVKGFTSDSAELAKAAESIDIRALGRVRTQVDRINNSDSVNMINLSTDTGNTFLGHAIENELGQEDRNDMKSRLDATFDAFQQLARAVDGIAGRKNLYWLAGEFPSSTYFTLQSIANASVGPIGAPGLGAVTNNFTGLDAGADPSTHRFSERVDRTIADSQIAVYPIDLTGVAPDNIGAANSGAGASAAASAAFDQRFNNRVAMHQIADETGGEAFYGNNDPAQMLKRGFEDGENFYTIAYQPSNHNWNGAYRKIAVKLNGGGYHLAYRRGYFALPVQPTGNSTQQFASAMQLATPPSTMLTVSALPPVELARGVMQFEATLGIESVTFANSADDQRRAKLQVTLIAYPLQAAVPPAQINNVLALGLTPADYEKVMKTGIPLRQTLHLKPGKYVIRLGVLDTVSGRIGTLTLPFTMPSA